jgi:hypothetical protein
MSLLIYSGLLYLIGVSVVLAIKPLLMFSKEGNWKEFGIGRPRERYTWMPFWLFAILWAIISYMIILVVVGNNSTPHMDTTIELNDIMEENGKINYSKKSVNSKMKKGYYILNTNNGMKGSPQLIYIGPKAPDLHYQDE